MFTASSISGRSALGDYVPPVRDGVFTLRIETDRKAYSVGDPIMLSLRITNISGSPMTVVRYVPWELSTLYVTRDGTKLTEGQRGTGERYSLANTYQLQPAASVLMRVWENCSDEPRYWHKITNWGYAFSEPGNYSIVASLNLLEEPQVPISFSGLPGLIDRIR